MSSYTELNLTTRLLLGPGPSMVHPRVLRALGSPTVSHFDSQFYPLLDEIQALLRMVFEAPDAYTIAISGTGTAGMEAALCNFIEEGDPVLVCAAGFFGERLAEMAGRYGADVVCIDVPWGEAFSARQIKEALDARPARMVAIVQGETSTGVLQPLEEIAKVAHHHGALFVVDTVATLGGVPAAMSETGIDICYSGSQKCLSCPPGLAPLALSPRALEVLNARKSKVSSYYLDLTLLQKYWGPERTYHHTVPVNMLYALREALRLTDEEGLQTCVERHTRTAHMFWEGLADLDLTPYVPVERRLPTLTTIRIPDGLDDMTVRRRLLDEFNIEIAGGLGALKGQIWRVGLMGYSCRTENVVTLLGALERVIK